MVVFNPEYVKLSLFLTTDTVALAPVPVTVTTGISVKTKDVGVLVPAIVEELAEVISFATGSSLTIILVASKFISSVACDGVPYNANRSELYNRR